MGENCPYEAKGPVLFPRHAVGGRNLPPQGATVKGPWWAVPGVVAIIGTLAIVSAAQGSLSTAKVTLPGSVQVPAAGAAARSTSAPPSSTVAGEGKVVAPSRPVVSQTDHPTSESANSGSGSGSGSGAQSGPTPGTDPSIANPDPQPQSGSGATSSPESGAGSARPGTGSSDPSGDNPSTTGPITTTSTTATSTTTTTKPPTRPEPGDQ